jgi:4-hydroxy-tetrahydrodipicolinate synthase
MEMSDKSFAGVLSPVLTPFTADLEVDRRRFVEHCRWLLDEGANGLAVFGTTSEANSLSAGERMALLEGLVEAGIDPALLMPGTGCCALPDTVALTRHAVELGCGGVLMLPPFYYKGVSDEGVRASIAAAIDRVGDDRLRVYLYHIPPMAQVGFSLETIGRLIEGYPGVVVGLKDSSGDWANTKAILDAFPDFATFPGSEVFLLDGLRNGGAGCITATGNVNVAMIRELFDTWRDDGADDLQARITAIRKTIQAYPMVPALKAIVAAGRNDPEWATVRPPLGKLPAEKAAALLSELQQHHSFALAA